jgi:hypothetical protein
MKHLKHTLQTYVYSYYNISNISICIATTIYNTCNIPLKHIKHLKYTLATCAFSVASTYCLDEWRLVDAELDAAEWRGGMPAGERRRGLGEQLCS